MKKTNAREELLTNENYQHVPLDIHSSIYQQDRQKSGNRRKGEEVMWRGNIMSN